MSTATMTIGQAGLVALLAAGAIYLAVSLVIGRATKRRVQGCVEVEHIIGLPVVLFLCWVIFWAIFGINHPILLGGVFAGAFFSMFWSLFLGGAWFLAAMVTALGVKDIPIIGIPISIVLIGGLVAAIYGLGFVHTAENIVANNLGYW